MTVAELRERIDGIPDDVEVVIGGFEEYDIEAWMENGRLCLDAVSDD